MPMPTEQLQELLKSGTDRQDFKQSVMALARNGADITIHSNSGANLTLLHVLARNNANGANNNEIAELAALNPAILASKDRYNRTALQLLIDAFSNSACSFDNFKLSAMALARAGADTTLASTYGATCLLHLLARNNANGANNNEIAELAALNPAILASKDRYNRTALQSLIDAFNYYGSCSFDNFKLSAMALARAGADTTLASTQGANPCLLHVLARNNANGANNNEIAELATLNPAILASKDPPVSG